MKAIDRLYEYFNIKSIKPTALEKSLGLSNGYLGTQRKRNADMGESIIVKIIDYCSDLSLEWLLTGTGSMLKQPDGTQKVPQASTPSTENALREIIREKDKRIETLAKTVGRLEHEIEELKKGSPYDDDDIEDVGGVACADVG